MARPKAYDRDAALVAARDLFWERGYEASSIADLEARTGLSRSSLYLEFGSKHDLFVAALDCYADQVIANLLADLRAPDAGLETVASLFVRLGALFRSPSAVRTRGCLLVNSTAELAARDESVRSAAAAYRDTLRNTFTVALATAARRGEIEAAIVEPRARLLAATLMGIWLTVRIDPDDASQLCHATADEIASWRATGVRRQRAR